MGSIDDILIEQVYAPVAGWMREHFGVCQWRAAIQCLNGSIAFYIAGLAFELASKGPDDAIFVTLLRGLVWLLIMDAVRRHAYRQAASSVGMRTARVREGLFRLVLIAVLPVSLVLAEAWDNLCYSGALALLICHLYFKATDVPPPEPKGRLAWNRA